LGIEAQDGIVVRVTFSPDTRETDTDALLQEAAAQLDAYFEGRLREFSLPMRADGTAFQQEVWRLVSAIAYGRTRTYMDIAKEMGSPGAVRAVGAANGANPLPILIPCHRVVATGGGMGGYGGGVDLKRRLLALEGAILL